MRDPLPPERHLVAVRVLRDDRVPGVAERPEHDIAREPAHQLPVAARVRVAASRAPGRPRWCAAASVFRRPHRERTFLARGLVHAHAPVPLRGVGDQVVQRLRQPGEGDRAEERRGCPRPSRPRSARGPPRRPRCGTSTPAPGTPRRRCRAAASRSPARADPARRWSGRAAGRPVDLGGELRRHRRRPPHPGPPPRAQRRRSSAPGAP